MRRMRMSRPAASRGSLRQFLSCRASKIALEHALVGPCEPWLWGLLAFRDARADPPWARMKPDVNEDFEDVRSVTRRERSAKTP